MRWLVFAAGCNPPQPPSSNPPETSGGYFKPVKISFTSPDGFVWNGVEGGATRTYATGSDCVDGVWLSTGAYDGSFSGVGELSRPGPIVVTEERQTASWDRDTFSATDRHDLNGGRGVRVIYDSTRFEYEIALGQDCVWDNTSDERICTVQAGPVIIVVNGDLQNLVEHHVSGVPGYATDAEGNQICVSEGGYEY